MTADSDRLHFIPVFQDIFQNMDKKYFFILKIKNNQNFIILYNFD